jgi:hypothetical protein
MSSLTFDLRAKTAEIGIANGTASAANKLWREGLQDCLSLTVVDAARECVKVLWVTVESPGNSLIHPCTNALVFLI